MSGFHIEMGGFQYAAAIDARHCTCLRRQDMAAGATRILMQYPQTINDNSWYINGNSCKKQPKTIRCSRIFSIPLRVCGKVVILQGRWPVNRAGRKIDPTSILAEIATKNKSSYLLGAFFISFARFGFFLDMGRRSNAVSSSCFDFPYHSVVTISLNSLPSR